MISQKFLLSILVFFLSCTYLMAQLPAFPGAEGFGAEATGGRGGKVLYVTNLNTDGPGSLQAAIYESGKRYILFKVSGVIPGTIEVPPGHGDFTLAAQTSPDGIIVRGFLSYNEENPSSNNFIIRHLRSRIGDRINYPSPHWIAEDGLTLGGVHNAIIDHCSFGHASDEAVDISRSSSITIQNCMLSETLGEHSYLGGMLINYSSAQSRLDSLSIHHNIWNRIGGRMPEISCESPYCNGKSIKLELSNNLAWDPRIELWYEGPTGNNGSFYLQMNAINNLYQAGPNYGNGMFHYDLLQFAQNKLYFSGNKMNLYSQYSDYQLFYCCNDFNTNHPNANTGSALRLNQRNDFPNISYTPLAMLKDKLADEVGAFPRDAMDKRLINNIKTNVIDTKSIDTDHYFDAFTIKNNKLAPADTDGDGMPDYWELSLGLDPGTQDHNNLNLSQKLYGVEGYTNLECYLHCLSDALVFGQSNDLCRIRLDITSGTANVDHKNLMTISPNPTTGAFKVSLSADIPSATLVISDIMGKKIVHSDIQNDLILELPGLHPGLFMVRLLSGNKEVVVQKLLVL